MVQESCTLPVEYKLSICAERDWLDVRCHVFRLPVRWYARKKSLLLWRGVEMRGYEKNFQRRDIVNNILPAFSSQKPWIGHHRSEQEHFEEWKKGFPCRHGKFCMAGCMCLCAGSRSCIRFRASGSVSIKADSTIWKDTIIYSGRCTAYSLTGDHLTMYLNQWKIIRNLLFSPFM